MTLRSLITSLLNSNLDDLNKELIVRCLVRDSENVVIKSSTIPVARVSATGAIIVEEGTGWTEEQS